MPLRIMTIDRYPSTDRGTFARAALHFCRAARVQPKIQMARYYWADTGDTIGIVVEGDRAASTTTRSPVPTF